MKVRSPLMALIAVSLTSGQLASASHPSPIVELTRSFLRSGSPLDAEAVATELTLETSKLEAKRDELVRFLLSEEAKTEAGSIETYRARGPQLDLVLTGARDSLYWKEYAKNLDAADTRRLIKTGVGAAIGAGFGYVLNRFQVVKPVPSADPTQQFLNIRAANQATREAAEFSMDGIRQSVAQATAAGATSGARANAFSSGLPMQLEGKQVSVGQLEYAISLLNRAASEAQTKFANPPVGIWGRITAFFSSPGSNPVTSVADADAAVTKALEAQLANLERVARSAPDITSVVGDDAAYIATHGLDQFGAQFRSFGWADNHVPLEIAQGALQSAAFAVQGLKNFAPLPGLPGATPSLVDTIVARGARDLNPVLGTSLNPFFSFGAGPGSGVRLIPVPFTPWQVAYVAQGIPGGATAGTRMAAGAFVGGVLAFSLETFEVIGVRDFQPPIVAPSRRPKVLASEAELDALFKSKK